MEEMTRSLSLGDLQLKCSMLHIFGSVWFCTCWLFLLVEFTLLILSFSQLQIKGSYKTYFGVTLKKNT